MLISVALALACDGKELFAPGHKTGGEPFRVTKSSSPGFPRYLVVHHREREDKQLYGLHTDYHAKGLNPDTTILSSDRRATHSTMNREDRCLKEVKNNK